MKKIAILINLFSLLFIINGCDLINSLKRDDNNFATDNTDTRGDINLNDIAYEIADAILYCNYFIYGETVFDKNIDKQINASDVNADSLTLSLADLVYLIRITADDAVPYPKNVNNVPLFVNGKFFKRFDGTIAILNDLNIGAAQIIVEGEITPTLMAENMSIIYDFDGDNTNILVYSLENNHFTNSLVNIGNAKIVSVKMADFKGARVVLNSNPAYFSLGQNYPNPFSSLTYFEFTLPIVADVTIEVRNISNEIVFESTSSYNTGIYQIEFDGSELAAGEYTYTMRTNSYENTKVMNIIH